jgi:hypothetical protein
METYRIGTSVVGKVHTSGNNVNEEIHVVYLFTNKLGMLVNSVWQILPFI